MRKVKMLFISLAIVAMLFLSMAINDLINPYTPIEVNITPDLIIYPVDDIRNPNNAPYVAEVAFNLGISPSEVTQEQFNERYIK